MTKLKYIFLLSINFLAIESGWTACLPSQSQSELQAELESLAPLVEHFKEGDREPRLKIEKDAIWISILGILAQSPSTDIMLIDNRSYRLDLTIADFQDQVDELLAKKFPDYKQLLAPYKKDFTQWYEKLISLAQEDKKLKRNLDQELLVQLYDGKGVALVHPITLTTSNRGKKISRNKDVKKFNKVANDPESSSLIPSLNLTIPEQFENSAFTVTKIDDLSQKEIEKGRLEYYKKYCEELYWAEEESIQPIEFSCDPKKKYPLKLKRSSLVSKEDKNDTVTLFNAIHAHPDKSLILNFLKQEIGFEGHLTPTYVKENQNEIEEALKEYTYHHLLSQEDDETVLKLRNWIHQNYNEIQSKLAEYNSNHPGEEISFSIKNPKFRVRRTEALDQYDELLKLFPDAPWIEGQEFTLVDAKGKVILTGKNRLEKLAWHVGNTVKQLLSPENVVAYGVGAAVILGTGNLMLASASKHIIHDAIRGYRYDVPLKEAFRDTPYDLAFSLTSTSGFSAVKMPYLMFVGSIHGGVRSAVTGQDIKTGMIVGAASELIRGSLPQEIGHPTVGLNPGDVIDGAYAAKAIALEAGFNTVYHGIQGATVAAIDGERISVGAAKGAIYGVGETALMVSLFGIQYDMHGLIGEEALAADFSLEAEYYNDVQTYGINLEGHEDLASDMMEASKVIDFRLAYGKTGQWVQKMLGNTASFSAPGFVTSPQVHLGSAGTMSHEVGHQIQYWDMGGANFLITYGVLSSKYGTYGSHENGFDVMAENPDRDVNVMEQYRNHD